MNNGILVQNNYRELFVNDSLPVNGIGKNSNTPSINGPNVGSYDPNNLVFVIDISKEPANYRVSIPLNGTVNCNIFWGDGTSETHTTTGFKTHIYEKPGIYIVQIQGRMTALGFGTGANSTDNKLKNVRCLSFGNIGLTSLNNGFRECLNMIECPSSLPSNITDLRTCFRGCSFFNDSNITQWNTSNIVFIGELFLGVTNFNQNISNWNTSSITNMGGAFGTAINFNQPIGCWNTSNATDMVNMFTSAVSFNQPLNNWNVRKVTNFTNMFYGATSFNSSLSGWALGADTAGTTCVNMFYGATNFNQDISNWDVSKVTDMQYMFYNCTNFNQNISTWVTNSVTNMSYMFAHTGANSFNQNIGNWNTSNVTNFSFMFWSNSTNLPFNQNLGNWNVSKGTSFQEMFRGCISVSNQDLRNWNIAGATAASALDNFMLGKTGANALSTTNYDALLINWNNNKLVGANGVANWRTDLRPNFGGSKYTSGGAAATARAALVSYGWTITDGGVA